MMGENWCVPLSRWRWTLFLGFLVWFLFIFIASFFSERFHVSRNLWWAIAFPLSALGPAFVQARRQMLDTALRLLPRRDQPMLDLVQTYVQRHETGRDPAIVGLVSALAFGAFRVSASWEVRDILYSWPFIIHTVILLLGIGCMAQTIWLILYYGRLINALTLRLSDQADRLFSWTQIAAMGNSYARASLGTALISLAFLVMVLTNYQLFAADMKTHTVQILFMEVIFCAAVIMPFAYLILPQWRLRTLLITRKELLLQRQLPLLIEAEHAMLIEDSRDVTRTERYLQRRREWREIEALPHWPFNIDAVAPMISVFAIPVILFLFKEVLVDLIIDWVKG